MLVEERLGEKERKGMMTWKQKKRRWMLLVEGVEITIEKEDSRFFLMGYLESLWKNSPGIENKIHEETLKFDKIESFLLSVMELK